LGKLDTVDRAPRKNRFAFPGSCVAIKELVAESGTA